jgi:hypothetical protein
MAGILDDLKGLLSAEDFAKLQGSPVATRLTRGDELRSYYDGDESETPPAAATPPAARQGTPPPPGQFDLSSIERMLDSKLGTIGATIDTKLEAAIKTRGDELVNNAVRIAVQRSDELSRIYGRHEREVGKPFDSAEFNTFLEKPETKAKGFRTLTDAYEAFVGPVVQEKTIATKVAEGVKTALAARSGENVPGTTPAPATNSNIRFFQKRTATGAAAETTGAGRAAAQLDRIMARRDEMAS